MEGVLLGWVWLQGWVWLLGWVWLHLCDGPPGSVAVGKQLLLPSGGWAERGRGR